MALAFGIRRNGAVERDDGHTMGRHRERQLGFRRRPMLWNCKRDGPCPRLGRVIDYLDFDAIVIPAGHHRDVRGHAGHESQGAIGAEPVAILHDVVAGPNLSHDRCRWNGRREAGGKNIMARIRPVELRPGDAIEQIALGERIDEHT